MNQRSAHRSVPTMLGHAASSSPLWARVLRLGTAAAILLGAAPARANYTAALNGTTLEVTGDSKSDQLALRLDATGTMLVVDVKNDGTADFMFDRSLFDAISVSAGGGDDTVIVDESSGLFTEKAITIDGGPGRDTLIGGSGNDTLIGGDDDDLVDAKRGNDTILLGAGDDVAVWDPGDGSDVIEGQDGDDHLEFHGANISERFEASPNGARVRFTRDIANIVMDLNGVEAVDLTTRGGTDVVTVDDLTGTDMKLVNVDLEGTPGSGVGDAQADTIVLPGTSGADVVTVSGTDGTVEADGLFTTVRAVHGDPTLDTIEFLAVGADEVHVNGTNKPDTITIVPSPIVGAMRALVDSFTTGVDVSGGGTLMVFGLGGGDTISGSNGLAGLPTALVIDGGPGDDVITGGDGADVLMGGPGSDTVSGGRGSDVLLLGTGADTAVWNPGDGLDTIEGQEGNDTLEFNGANIGERFEVSPNGSRVRFTRDIANVVMDLNGVEQIGLTARGGADNLVVDDLAGTDMKSVTVDLAGVPGTGTGDGQVDTVVVNGTPAKDRMRVRVDSHGDVLLRRKGRSVRIQAAEPTDALTVNGLGGGDRIRATPSVASAITLTINP